LGTAALDGQKEMVHYGLSTFKKKKKKKTIPECQKWENPLCQKCLKIVRASKVMSENVPMKTQIIKNHRRDCHGYGLIELIIELIALLEISSKLYQKHLRGCHWYTTF
jgi:hypothetical protein